MLFVKIQTELLLYKMYFKALQKYDINTLLKWST